MKLLSAGLVSLMVCACAGEPAAPAPEQRLPPFKPVADVRVLMESVIAHAAEVYWESVEVVVSDAGIEENYPENDEEWEAVWAAGLTLAESGNLLMMAPRARDDDAWMTFAAALVDAGVAAAAAGEAKNPDLVFEAGAQVYDACTACHTRYIPQ